MQDMRELLEGKELITKTDKYELYIDRETDEVMIYSIEFEDIWTIEINDLGNIGFDHYLK